MSIFNKSDFPKTDLIKSYLESIGREVENIKPYLYCNVSGLVSPEIIFEFEQNGKDIIFIERMYLSGKTTQSNIINLVLWNDDIDATTFNSRDIDVVDMSNFFGLENFYRKCEVLNFATTAITFSIQGYRIRLKD